MTDKDETFPHDTGQDDAGLHPAKPVAETVAEDVDTQASKPASADVAKKKKHSFIKTLLLLLLVSIGAAWAFWQFNNAALQSFFENIIPASRFYAKPSSALTAEENTAQPAPKNIALAAKETALETTSETLLSTDTSRQVNQAISPYDINLDNTEANILIPDDVLTPEVAEPIINNNVDFTALADLQINLAAIESRIQTMEQRQLSQIRFEVRSAMFTLLNRASSSTASLLESANAWKSITFLANINPEKRDLAEQAFQDLRSAQQHVQAISDEIKTNIYALAQMLKPTDAAIVNAKIDANNVEALVDLNWFEWIKDQFHFSKVSQDVLVLADRYQTIKLLIDDLQRLQNNLQDNVWTHSSDIDALVHQLEQRGIDTTLSTELLQTIAQTQQQWQQEAIAWMEQL